MRPCGASLNTSVVTALLPGRRRLSDFMCRVLLTKITFEFERFASVLAKHLTKGIKPHLHLGLKVSR